MSIIRKWAALFFSASPTSVLSPDSTLSPLFRHFSAPRPRRLPAFLALLALVLLLPPLALFTGCSAQLQPQASPDAGAEEEPAVPVEVAEAYRGDVEVTISFTGVLEPEMSVNVVHKTGGKVAEVRVKDGEEVRPGELLIRLDAAEISAQVAQAEAALLMAQVQFENAAQSLEDTRALYEAEIVSRQQFEQVETQYRVAEAQLAQAEAALQLARTQLDNTLLTAPISGTVSGVTVNPGEMISPGVPVVTINKMDTMQVRVQLTEKDVVRIALGQKVKIAVSAVSSDLLEGEVTAISPVADPMSKTYELKAALPNEAGRLKAGMSATLYAVVDAEKDTVIVPVEAVLTREGKPVVYVVEEGLARRRAVTLGLENGTLVSVREGVSPGEQVVVKGQHYLQEGGKVTVVGGGTKQ